MTPIVDRCELCGAVHVPVRHGLVAWREWESIGHRYEDVFRCQDVEACKQRVAALGEPWPVEDPRAA